MQEIQEDYRQAQKNYDQAHKEQYSQAKKHIEPEEKTDSKLHFNSN